MLSIIQSYSSNDNNTINEDNLNNQNKISSEAMRNDAISDEEFRGFPRNSFCGKMFSK
jgi:hypothetical protein